MALSWNEIRSNALAFSKEWAGESSEDAEAKSFWDAFFAIFGVTRRRIASFEEPVRKSDGRGGFIDLLWRGVLLVEHKSRGKDLDRAFHQATDYFHGLKERDLPRYVLVSDFARFRLYDLDGQKHTEFELKDLHKRIGLFGFVAGYQSHRADVVEEAANIKAAEQLGKLHDLLKASGYVGHPLEVLLVRLLFCLFADDTGIFERRNQFKDYLEVRTTEDGVDLGQHLSLLFQVLNTPVDGRQRNLDELLAGFTYVNGRLFEETLPIPAFDRAMRETLLDACGLDWSRISPAIFGSLFQSIMDKDARRNLGAHYTRESNILRALRPLFLDGLDAELVTIGSNARKLGDFKKKLAGIRILDPACGCGNFLVIAYRELRRLELEVLRRLLKAGESSRALDIASLVYVDVDQFYGIEIEEFPAQIAQVALWLTDHQMNQVVSEEFGAYFARLPLKKSANIVYGAERGNALRIDWKAVVDPALLTHIVGNPPFIGAKMQSDEQRADVDRVFQGTRNAGLLDYVCCWYRKSAEYIQGTQITVAFVSTNSITQGEQVGVLWPDLFARGVKIHFAHRTFQWSSEARGKAAVHCVIVGFGLQEPAQRVIFDYEDIRREPHAIVVNRINAYLVDGPDVAIGKRSVPLCSVPEMKFGNQPIDGGHLILDPDERRDILAMCPQAENWIRPFLGATEFINAEERYCIWLVGVSPAEIRSAQPVYERIQKVREFRLASDRPATRELANNPSDFAFVSHPDTNYLLVPSVSSERRAYVPIGFMPPSAVASNLCLIVPRATLLEFGVLTSSNHMAWMRAVCGRLKSDYRYSAGIVYNNFPWPESTAAQKAAIEVAAQGVLDARAAHGSSTLADLYDPLTMPADLLKAHQKVDRAVDAAYGRKDFKTEAERVAFLFERYQALSAPLATEMEAKPKRKRARK